MGGDPGNFRGSFWGPVPRHPVSEHLRIRSGSDHSEGAIRCMTDFTFRPYSAFGLPLASRRLIEIGCGSGQNLLDLLRFGFQPESGVDLENFRPLPVRSLFSSGDIVVGTVKTLEEIG